jgi:hypothetical protein
LTSLVLSTFAKPTFTVPVRCSKSMLFTFNYLRVRTRWMTRSGQTKSYARHQGVFDCTSNWVFYPAQPYLRRSRRC